MMKKLFFGFLFFSCSFFVLAQDSAIANSHKEATGLRAEGKIYVVLAVAVAILIGLFIYLIRIDRKIARLEKGNSE
jgi:hypothetical protein